MRAFCISDWMVDRATAEGSRIQSAETKCDESAAQPTTMPVRAATIRYVHRRWCRTLMPASCRCRSLRRRAYSCSGISYAVLVKASRPANSEVVMDTPFLSRPRSLIPSSGKNRRRQRRTNDGMCFKSRGLQRENWWGTLKEGRETWSVWNCAGRPRSLCPSPIDDQREKTDRKCLEAGY